MTRAFRGRTKNHYSFGINTPSIPLITAVGWSPLFAYHKSHTGTKIALTAVGSSTCICDTGVAGKLCETGGQNCAQFTKKCVAPNPLNYTGVFAGSLLRQKNPTCSS